MEALWLKELNRDGANVFIFFRVEQFAQARENKPNSTITRLNISLHHYVLSSLISLFHTIVHTTDVFEMDDIQLLPAMAVISMAFPAGLRTTALSLSSRTIILKSWVQLHSVYRGHD